MTKTCRKCGIEKSIDDFYKDKRRSDGRHAYCKSCRSNADKQSYILNAEVRRETAKARYHENKTIISLRRMGLTEQLFQEMLTAQDFKCAICSKEESVLSSNGEIKRMSIDHNRRCCNKRENICGKCIRGLLCSKCNSGLGFFDDNIETLRRAIEYLEQSDKFI